MKNEKILYIHLGLSSFVKKDIEILNNCFQVKSHLFSISNKKYLFFSLIKEFFFLLSNVLSSKKVIIQFAGYHSFIPVIFTKIFSIKTIIVLGGTDCVSFPSIQYGNHSRKILKHITAFSIKNASLLLPVDQSLVSYNYTFSNSDNKKQGYLEYVKNVSTPYKVIHNGYNDLLWKKLAEKEVNSFVTVGGNLTSRFGFQLKGIDLIFDIAPFFPNCKFYIVGGKNLKKETPINVILVDNIPNEKLVNFLSEKEFYLQLSMSEGFPNALCEAMLCECIPIVSNVGAMPMIVEKKGYILKKKSKSDLIILIKEALNSKNKLQKGKDARKIIQENYSFSKRSNEFLEAIKSLD